MAAFGTNEWIAQLDDALASSTELSSATADLALTVGQHVTEGPNGDLAWTVVIDHGLAHAHSGSTDSPDVTFTQDYATAKAVATGGMSAQSAFMLGKLRIGGDVAKLMEHAAAFDALDDLFIDVRSQTTY